MLATLPALNFYAVFAFRGQMVRRVKDAVFGLWPPHTSKLNISKRDRMRPHTPKSEALLRVVTKSWGAP